MKADLANYSFIIGWLNGWAGAYTVDVPACPFSLLSNYYYLAGAAVTGAYPDEAEA